MALTTHPAKVSKSQTPYQLDPEQTLKASRALLDHLRKETNRLQSTSSKKDLLKAEDGDSEDEVETGDDTPVWLILTTKQHIVDKGRLLPSKIPVPHSLNASPDLSICIISADPQRALKSAVADDEFPKDLSTRITKIIGLTKLKARYKSFEQRRALRDEYDIFLADDRIANRLPEALGKVFYKGTSKRPIPVDLASHKREDGKRQNQEKGKKKSDDRAAAVAPPKIVAKEIVRGINTVPVNLKPGTSVAVRVGLGSFSAEQLAENTEAVVNNIIEKHVVKGWRNVKSVHVKSPTSAALPIWLADELWAEEETVQEAQGEETTEDGSLKRKRNANTSKGPQSGSRKKVKPLSNDNSRDQRLAAEKAKAFSDAARTVMV